MIPASMLEWGRLGLAMYQEDPAGFAEFVERMMRRAGMAPAIERTAEERPAPDLELTGGAP